MTSHGDDLFDEAVDVVEVVRRLWDSWEDDAVIRDVASGRYVDRDKLHYIDFVGTYFSVKGPSITPRPPQGQPVVAALAHARPVYEFAVAQCRSRLHHPEGRRVACGASSARSRRRGWRRPEGLRRRLRRRSRGVVDSRSDALVFDGTRNRTGRPAAALASSSGVDGVRLRPAVNAIDLPVIVDEVVPLLQRAGRFRTGYRDGETLRERLGLPVADNRYARVEPS